MTYVEGGAFCADRLLADTAQERPRRAEKLAGASKPPEARPEPSLRVLAADIQARADNGATAAEIGQALGMSRQRVMRIARRERIRLQPRGGSRRRRRA